MAHELYIKHSKRWCFTVQRLTGAILFGAGVASLFIMGRPSLFSVVPLLLGSYCLFTRRVFVE